MTCWVCSGSKRVWLEDSLVRVEVCRACGHLFIEHLPARATEKAQDYHAECGLDSLLQSLFATRERQAHAIVNVLRRLGVHDRLLDYGCGRGIFLKVASVEGFLELAGADNSKLATDWLRSSGFSAVDVDPASIGLALVSNAGLPFVPRAISFLDVIEHFPGDLVETFRPWIRDLPPQTELLVFKVPVRQGILFRAAHWLHTAGVPGPLRQLFQVGSLYPHLQYFSHRSLSLFCQRLGLTVVEVWDDPDFEPATLGARAPALQRLPEVPVQWMSGAVARVAKTLKACDSRAVFARRLATTSARDDARNPRD